MMANARNAKAAPAQPMDDVMCVVNVNRRRAGVIMFDGPPLLATPFNILADSELNDR